MSSDRTNFDIGGGGGGGGYMVTLATFIFLVRNLCFAGSLLIMIRQNSGPN